MLERRTPVERGFGPPHMLAAALALLLAGLAATPSQSRGPDSVADVAAGLQDAVVNISTTQTLKASPDGASPDGASPDGASPAGGRGGRRGAAISRPLHPGRRRPPGGPHRRRPAPGRRGGGSHRRRPRGRGRRRAPRGAAGCSTGPRCRRRRGGWGSHRSSTRGPGLHRRDGRRSPGPRPGRLHRRGRVAPRRRRCRGGGPRTAGQPRGGRCGPQGNQPVTLSSGLAQPQRQPAQEPPALRQPGGWAPR